MSLRIEPSLRTPSRLRRSLTCSLAEGVLAELVSATASAAVLTAWALFLRMPVPLIGLLGSLPFAAQALQLPAAFAAGFFGNRRTALAAISISRQIPLLLCALPFLPLSLQAQQAMLLVVAGLACGLSVAGNNAWTGWMGELVPEAIRGRYFGKRSAFCALGAAVGALGVGFALDSGGAGSGRFAARGGGLHAWGGGPALAALTFAGCVCGLLTTLLLFRQHTPAATGAGRRAGEWTAHPAAPRKPKLGDVLAPLRSDSARRLIAFQIVWCASSGLSAAFYPLHMVQTLHMGFFAVALYTTGISAARMFAAPGLGRAIDRHGAPAVLRLAAFGLILSPILWMFPRQGLLWPLALDAVLCGALMAAQSLASFSLSLSTGELSQRSFHLAAFAAAGGLAAGLGALGGGVLLARLPSQVNLFGLGLVRAQLLFLLGDAGRLGAALLALRITRPRAAARVRLTTLPLETGAIDLRAA